MLKRTSNPIRCYTICICRLMTSKRKYIQLFYTVEPRLQNPKKKKKSKKILHFFSTIGGIQIWRHTFSRHVRWCTPVPSYIVISCMKFEIGGVLSSLLVQLCLKGVLYPVSYTCFIQKTRKRLLLKITFHKFTVPLYWHILKLLWYLKLQNTMQYVCILFVKNI